MTTTTEEVSVSYKGKTITRDVEVQTRTRTVEINGVADMDYPGLVEGVQTETTGVAEARASILMN